jgi:hypothetical protein
VSQWMGMIVNLMKRRVIGENLTFHQLNFWNFFSLLQRWKIVSILVLLTVALYYLKCYHWWASWKLFDDLCMLDSLVTF